MQAREELSPPFSQMFNNWNPPFTGGSVSNGLFRDTMFIHRCSGCIPDPVGPTHPNARTPVRWHHQTIYIGAGFPGSGERRLARLRQQWYLGLAEHLDFQSPTF